MCQHDYLPLCTIAGSDPTGGAGLQGDLRTFAAHGGHGTGIVTAITVQDERGVSDLSAVDAALVRAQLDVVLTGQDRPRALKIGMLAQGATLHAVADAFDRHGAPPLVVDPVLSAGAGGTLLAESALPALTARLAPHAVLLTPNLPEAARLLGREAIGAGEEVNAAEALRALGWRSVLLKGGHGEGRTVRDVFVDPDGTQEIVHPRVAGGPFHGTGCALSAAIAARLGRGELLRTAIPAASGYVHRLVEHAARRKAWLLAHLAVATGPS